MSWIEALILGIIQGLTEFLPVSSSGHLEIGHALLGISGKDNLTFAIVVHTATVLSTITVFRSQIAKLINGTLTSLAWNEEKQYVSKILFSMIPVMVVGFFLKDQVEALFGSGLLVVGFSLCVTALLLAFAYYAKPKRKERISYRDAFVIGIAQAIAVLPGLSRSGSTIATGLILGNKRESIAQFSFLMVLIPILGEALLETIDLIQVGSMGAGLPLGSLIAGFISAYIAGCLACKFMIKLVSSGKLLYFAIYCAIVGVFALIFSII